MGMAERIKQKRLEKGLTQEELGEKLGLQKSAIAKYENGRVENIKRSTIVDMAKILECSPSYLMGWEESDENPEVSDDIRRIARAHSKMPEDVKKRFITAVTASFQDYFSDDFEDTDTEE